MELSDTQKNTLVENFRSRAIAWWNKIEGLNTLSIPDKTFLSERRKNLIKQAWGIRLKIESIPGMSKTFEQGLGYWPIAVAIAGAAAIAWALAAFKSTGNEADRIKMEAQKYNDLRKSGLTPENAMNKIRENSVAQKSWSDVAYKTLQTLPWVGAAYIAFRVANIIDKRRS